MRFAHSAFNTRAQLGKIHSKSFKRLNTRTFPFREYGKQNMFCSHNIMSKAECLSVCQLYHFPAAFREKMPHFKPSFTCP